MNLLCTLFGHKISEFLSYQRYFSAKYGAIDGCDRHHIQLFAECDRCGTKFKVGNIHGTEKGNVLLSKDKE